MSKASAMMVVFAGNNGSGKSMIRNLIVDKLGLVLSFILILNLWLARLILSIQIVVKFQLEKKPFNLYENAYPMSEIFRLRQLLLEEM